MPRTSPTIRLLIGLGFLAFTPVLANPPDTRPVIGLRDHTPAVHALAHARIVLGPGRVVDRGTLVVRDGAIIEVGADVAVPADARIWDLTGKTIYPGLIDAYAEVPLTSASGGAPYWNSLVTPQGGVASQYTTDSATNEKLRKQGFVARLIAPQGGIIKGTSALVTTRGAGGDRDILQANVALHVRLGVPRGRSRDAYPNSPMGAVALARQAFYDAQWYGQAWGAFAADSRLPRPERNDALAALQPFAGGRQSVVFDAANELYFLRADAFAREFSLQAVIRGSGQEYQRLDAIRATGRPVIVPVNFPRPPVVDSPEAAADVELHELLHWDLAPENPARLSAAGVTMAFTSSGLRDVADFLAGIRTAVERGLARDAALASLTSVPAQLFGAANRLGTLDAGKGAHLFVTDGDLFDKKTKILETWVDGVRFEIQSPPPFDARGEWRLTATAPRPSASGGETPTTEYGVVIKGTPSQLQGTLQVPGPDGKSQDVKLNKLAQRDLRLTGTFEAKALGTPGIAQFSGTIILVDPAAPTISGTTLFPDGQTWTWAGTRTGQHKSSPADKPQPDSDKPDSDKPDSDKPDSDKPDADKPDADKPDADKPDVQKPSAKSSFDVLYPLHAFGRERSADQPQDILIQNATLWTCGPQGVLDKASLLVHRGRIVAVGPNLAAPAGALVVDAAGKHVSPGIIDCHSHMATDGGVNESTQAITAEVRLADFIDSNDVDIYRQLAGGVTSANILHGSANPIGGQNQVIKLRWGLLPEELKFAEAPPGIKFALGENVKQSNWGEGYTSRYPQSRMGVEQLMRDAFRAAQQYRDSRQRWEQHHDSLPPRRDLELDALLEIVEGKRLVHCHSYRQDEILALLRACEEFGIRIATLQHILEGYKVADAMARHGAMGSSFSDWWAYKIEVYDAIPYAGALMHHAGVVVSFNSDDRELARHLNHEAAKAVKYGGVPPEEALKFVTLNPARQLRVDALVGSLEVGKHADFVIWSGPPLSVLSRCEQTWIDGRKYFDRQDDQQRREQNRKMRSTLVQKILASGQTSRTAEEAKKPDEELWPRFDEFCRARR